MRVSAVGCTHSYIWACEESGSWNPLKKTVQTERIIKAADPHLTAEVHETCERTLEIRCKHPWCETNYSIQLTVSRKLGTYHRLFLFFQKILSEMVAKRLLSVGISERVISTPIRSSHFAVPWKLNIKRVEDHNRSGIPDCSGMPVGI